MAKKPATPPAPPRVPSKTPFAEAWAEVIKDLNRPGIRLNKLKAEFVEIFSADPLRALEWKSETIMRAQYDASLATQLKMELFLIAYSHGEGVVLAGIDEATVKVLEENHGERPNKVAAENATVDALELLAVKMVAACRTMRDNFTVQTITKAKYPRHSTSPCANLIGQHELAAYAEAVEYSGIFTAAARDLEGVYTAR